MAKVWILLACSFLLQTLAVRASPSIRPRTHPSVPKLGRSDGKTEKLCPKVVIVSLVSGRFAKAHLFTVQLYESHGKRIADEQSIMKVHARGRGLA